MPESQQQYCKRLQQLDIEYQTDTKSPLHHDNRCPLHGPIPPYENYDLVTVEN